MDMPISMMTASPFSSITFHYGSKEEEEEGGEGEVVSGG